MLQGCLEKTGADYGLEGIKDFFSEDRYGPVVDWSSPGDAKRIPADFVGRSDLQSWLRDRHEAFSKFIGIYTDEGRAERQKGAKEVEPVCQVWKWHFLAVRDSYSDFEGQTLNRIPESK
jgi:hypothetical protein